MNKNKHYFATNKFRKSIESFFYGTFLSKKSDNKDWGNQTEYRFKIDHLTCGKIYTSDGIYPKTSFIFAVSFPHYAHIHSLTVV